MLCIGLMKNTLEKIMYNTFIFQISLFSFVISFAAFFHPIYS